MNEPELDDTLIRRFLLSDLSAEQHGQVEEQAFLSRDSFELLEASEDELIDEYLYGDLPAAEKSRFETHFLVTPQRRASLRIARALQRYASESSTLSPGREEDKENRVRAGFTFLDAADFRHRLMRFSVAACILLLLGAGAWIVVRKLRRHDTLPTQAKQETPGRDQRSTNAVPGPSENRPRANGPENVPRQALPSAKQSPVALSSFLLLPGGPVRGDGEITKVRLTAASGRVLLHLPLIEPAAYRSYQATLQTSEGQVVRRWADLTIRRRESLNVVQLEVPVEVLAAQQRYLVVLSGVSFPGQPKEVSAYHFQVLK